MKAKTQVSATPTPVAAAGKLGGQSLFDSQDAQSDSDDALDYGSSYMSVGSSDPPEKRLQRAEEQGHHFKDIAIATYKPATPPISAEAAAKRKRGSKIDPQGPSQIQRQVNTPVQERQTGRAINRTPFPFDYGQSASSRSHVNQFTGEKWEDGAVSLKAEPGADQTPTDTANPVETGERAAPPSPGKTAQPSIQRQASETVKERWEGGAVSLKAENPLASQVSSFSGEKWENGMVTLKAESSPPEKTAEGSPDAPEAVIQAKDGDGSFSAGSNIEKRLQNSKGGGQPLGEGTRDFMESRFSNDFGNVRVHTNTEAVQMSKDLKAQAFTHGNDVYFNSGKYKPESSSGKRLLAHELTHTIQQTGPSTVNPKRLAKKAEKANKQKPAEAAKGEVTPLAQRLPMAGPPQTAAISEVGTQSAGLLENSALTVQPDLVVGAVGDRYEQEADQMADRVMQMQDSHVARSLDIESDSEPDIEPDIALKAEPDAIALKPLTSISSVSGVVQRDKKDDIKSDVADAVKGINEEVNSKKKDKEGSAGAEKAAGSGRKLADDAKGKMANTDDEDKAKEEAGKLEEKSDKESKNVQDGGEKTKEDEAKKQETDDAQIEEEAVVEQEKQVQETDAAAAAAQAAAAAKAAGKAVKATAPGAEGAKEGAEGATAENAEAPPEEAAEEGLEGDAEAAPGDEAVNVAPAGMPEPGMVVAPEQTSEKSPASVEEDPAFAVAVTQTEQVAAEQSTHKPAAEKAQEAQDSATDPNQQTRSAQATQSEEAGAKEPQIFDREGFINALLAVLESNKPQSQGDVEKGKGMGGASDQVTAELDKAKDSAGGGLQDAATRPPDPTVEAPKTVVPTPEAITEAGEKPPDETIDPVAATPKAKTESEVEAPLDATKESIDTLVPKAGSPLPPIQLKLMVGAPGDRYEREADNMADAVMAMPDAKQISAPPKANQQSPVQAAAETPGVAAQSIQPQTTETQAGETEDAVDDQSTSEITASDSLTPPETVQRQPGPINLPDIQLLPGLFLQRQATLEAEALTQDDNPVPLDEHRLEMYEKEAGVNATGAIEEGQQHFGGDAQAEFRQAEATQQTNTQAAQTASIATKNEDMFATRQAEFANVQATQQETTTQDESERGRVTQEIQAIYDETKVNVNTILGNMDARVAAEFAATDKRAKAVFERRQKQLFKEWKQKYYKEEHPLWIPWMEVKTGWAYVKVRFYMKKFFNTPLWLVNKVFTGLPKEVNEIYEIAREDYLAVQREGVHRIADIVEEGMNAAKKEVDNGRQRVNAYVESLPDDLKSVGAEAAAKVQAQFDSLEQSVRDKQAALVDDLKAKYEASLQEIDDRISELKAANASLVSKIASAIADVAKWIFRQVLKVLEPPLKLIPGIGSKIGQFLDAFVDDPGGIMKTLFKGLGEGFKNFGKNIKKHLINGLFEWLLGADIPIVFPKKFDLQGIIDILLQILGVSKDAIFALVDSLLPSWAGELLRMIVDQGIGVLSNIMGTLEELGVPSYVIAFFKAMAELPKKGIMALWDFLKTVFASLKGEFLTTLITDMIIPEVVIAGIQWLMGLLNPAAGIFKIVKAIVDVVIFLFNNKDMIFEVLKSVGKAFSALITKSWSPVAMAVEIALANIIPLALGLFVSLIGLGGIPKRIGKVMEKLRKPVDKGLTKVLDKMGVLLDPIGAVAGGVSGLKDKAKSKWDKKRGKDTDSKDSTSSSKDDDDKQSSTQTDKDDDDTKSDRKTTDTPSTKKDSKSVADSPSTTKTGKPDPKDQTTGKDKKKEDDDDIKKKKDDDDKQKTKEEADDSKQRLSAGMREVDRITEQKRDPSSVKKELSKVKSKHELTSLELKESRFSKKKYTITGQAKAETSSSKKSSKKTTVSRKPLSGAAGVPTLQLKSSKKNDWNDKSSEVAVKTKLKHKKKKGGDFTVDAELIEQDKVLKEVEKKLKRKIKFNARTKKVEPYLRTLKAQYKLKTLKLSKLQPDGGYYRIVGELDKNKSTAQRKAVPGASGHLQQGDAIEARIQRAAGKGQPIVPKVREPLEEAFGADFSPVRIHAGAEGNHLSNVLQAKAFTTGPDIFFRQGAYAPDSPSGKHLLAHELTHVVQQSGERPDIMSQPVPREGADPPPIQRSPQSPDLWIQREVDDGMSTVMTSAAVVGGSVAADVGMAAGREAISSALPPGAKIKSSITRDNTYMAMFVTVKERSLDNRTESEVQDEMPDEEGLSDSTVSRIVEMVQDIVNQNPDDDVVARKLDKVRVLFGVDLVKLVGYAEVGDKFEYIIKIKGQAKFLLASKADRFLKRMGMSAPKTGAARSTKPKPGKSAASAMGDSPTPMDTPSKSSFLQDPGVAETAKPTETANSDQSTAANFSSESTTGDSGRTTETSPGKAKPSSSKKDSKSKAKVEQAQEREIKINAKVRRIDAHTVDVTIRATPQSKRKTD
ncbi:MAG: DUF4157 domain-containing protein [Cyanobacteria bacterium J06639_16]